MNNVYTSQSQKSCFYLKNSIFFKNFSWYYFIFQLCDLNFTKLKYLAQHILESSHGENQVNNAESTNLLKNETVNPVDDIQDEKDLSNIEDEDFKIENDESNLENLEDKM